MNTHESKLAMLGKLRPGWNRADAEPLHPQAEANYAAWVATIPADRASDAEPMLTDEGYIRLEWDSDGHSRIAEIGPVYLYLVDLAPEAKDDASLDLPFDEAALNRFFIDGRLT